MKHQETPWAWVKRGVGIPLVIVLGWFLVSSCQEQKQSPIKGRLKILAAESVSPIIQKEVSRFEELYPEAHFDVSYVSSREAIVKLINGEVSLIIVGREFNAEEDSIIRHYKIDITKHVIAYDGIAALVNEKNPVRQLKTTDLAAILSGKVKKWSSFKGGFAEPITVVTQGPNSATYELLSQLLLDGKRFSTPIVEVKTSSEVIDDVASARFGGALGFVGLAPLHGISKPVRPLELADPSVLVDTLRTTAKIFPPHPAYVYLHYYPLTRPIVLYTTETGFGLAAGFISFITSPDGQRIFLDGGLVPATQPVKLVPSTFESN